MIKIIVCKNYFKEKSMAKGLKKGPIFLLTALIIVLITSLVVILTKVGIHG